MVSNLNPISNVHFPRMIVTNASVIVALADFLIGFGYRDFRRPVPFMVQFGLYVSPVGFSTSVVPEQSVVFPQPDGRCARWVPLVYFGRSKSAPYCRCGRKCHYHGLWFPFANSER
jgi:ABC-type polysaccharide/polyol phosphate export permease